MLFSETNFRRILCSRQMFIARAVPQKPAVAAFSSELRWATSNWVLEHIKQQQKPTQDLSDLRTSQNSDLLSSI